MQNNLLSFESILREQGLRATKERLLLLKVLQEEKVPRSIEYLSKKLAGSVNKVTLYRALETLASAGIVERSALGHEHMHYELSLGRARHYHAVCTHCSFVEDVAVPSSKNLAAVAFADTKDFNLVHSYSLEFFGVCKMCVKK